MFGIPQFEVFVVVADKAKRRLSLQDVRRGVFSEVRHRNNALQNPKRLEAANRSGQTARGAKRVYRIQKTLPDVVRPTIAASVFVKWAAQVECGDSGVTLWAAIESRIVCVPSQRDKM